MATMCIGIRMVAARTTTVMPVTERHRRCSTAVGSLPLYQLLRPFAVGLVHGLAGSAAIPLVVLTIIRDPILAAYLLLFGIGTIGGMMLLTLLLTASFVFTSVPRFNWQLAVASGLISFAFGLFLASDIGFADGGLFTRQSEWATTLIGRAVQLRSTC